MELFKCRYRILKRIDVTARALTVLSLATFGCTACTKQAEVNYRITVIVRDNGVVKEGDKIWHLILRKAPFSLGSGLVDHSQKMTVAARATAEKKAMGQRS